MTKKYRPSNGTEGMDFMAQWCDKCQLDDGEKLFCEILSASMCYEMNEPDYPSEWIYKEGQPCCTAFVSKENAAPQTKTTYEGSGCR